MESAAPPIEEPARAARHSRARLGPSAEDIAWLGLWPVALALLAAMLWLAPPLSHLIPGPSADFFPQWRSIIKPEPTETVRFLMALAAPAGLAAAVLLGSAREPDRRFDPAAIALQVGAIALIVWSVLEQPDGPFLPFVPDAPGYFEHYLLSVPVLVIGLLAGAGLTILALTRKRLFDLLEGAASPRWELVALIAALVVTALWLLPAVVTDSSVGSSGQIPTGHIPTQAEDYFAVVNGRTPMVDFAAQYAQLLPLAIAPLLRAFDLTLTSFSVLMTVLSLGILLAVYGAFREVTGRPIPALVLYVPFLALSLIPWAQDGLVREFNGNYYGFFPGRYLGPFVIIWLCAMHVRGRRIPAWLLFFAAGLAIFNNAEFGAPCMLALIVALLLGSDSSRGWRRTIRALAPPAIAGFAGAVATVCAITLARTGELPDLYLLTYYSRLFGRQSLGLEPMPTLGLHIAFYITYLAALLLAAVRHVRNDPDRTLTAMLAFSAVFGLLGGAYFAGRSWPWQLLLLFPMWGFALALLAWAAWLHLRPVSDLRQIRRSFLPATAAMVGFGIMIASIITFPAPWKQFDRLSEGGPAVEDVPAARAFVEHRTTPGEPVLIFGTPIDHRLAEQAGVDNVSPWNGILSLFTAAEVQRALDALSDAGGSKLFIRRSAVGPGSAIRRYLEASGFRESAPDRKGILVQFQRVGRQS